VLCLSCWFFYTLSLFQTANRAGIIISPLQQILVTQETTKRPTSSYFIQRQTDIPDICSHNYDYGYGVVKLQAAFQDASLSPVQQNLWARGHPCAASYSAQLSRLHDGFPCTGNGATFYSLSSYPVLEDPFVAQLPSGFNTGLLRQYAPRVNTTATYMEVNKIPDECMTGQSFQASFSGPENRTDFRAYWSISICLPVIKYPIQGVRERQDFQEDLYMTIETFTNDHMRMFSTGAERLSKSTYKLSMQTTIGYFELPNYYNDGIPGPLIDKSHRLKCVGGPCMGQTPIPSQCGESAEADMEQIWHFSSEPYQRLMFTKNRGPLTTIALALFGNSSFLSTVHTKDYTTKRGVDFCLELAPLSNLMEKDADRLIGDALHCVSAKVNPDQAVAIWLTRFSDTDLMKTVWDQAAFLANQIWIIPDDRYDSTMTVNTAAGKDTQKPTMSVVSMVIVSALLGIDLLALAILAFVASRSVLWTQTLDALALVRIGAALGGAGDELLHFNKDADILDRLPGYMGDDSTSTDVGTISLGSQAPLRTQRSYTKRLGYSWDDAK
jgi:hypothetical protein